MRKRFLIPQKSRYIYRSYVWITSRIGWQRLAFINQPRNVSYLLFGANAFGSAHQNLASLIASRSRILTIFELCNLLVLCARYGTESPREKWVLFLASVISPGRSSHMSANGFMIERKFWWYIQCTIEWKLPKVSTNHDLLASRFSFSVNSETVLTYAVSFRSHGTPLSYSSLQLLCYFYHPEISHWCFRQFPRWSQTEVRQSLVGKPYVLTVAESFVSSWRKRPGNRAFPWLRITCAPLIIEKFGPIYIALSSGICVDGG